MVYDSQFVAIIAKAIHEEILKEMNNSRNLEK